MESTGPEVQCENGGRSANLSGHIIWRQVDARTSNKLPRCTVQRDLILSGWAIVAVPHNGASHNRSSRQHNSIAVVALAIGGVRTANALRAFTKEVQCSAT